MPEKMLPVHDAVSVARSFDERRLELFRWIADRYVAPLAAVIERAVPPRVASEEAREPEAPRITGSPPSVDLPGVYTNGHRLREALEAAGGTFVVRPAPGDDAEVAVACVSATLGGGRTAIVVVPEVDPEPATARALADAFGDRVARFFGGSKRGRYRMWLDIAAGRYPVVIGTRPAVFAPVPRLGLVYVAREQHSLHREERSPYFHVRDVAVARAGFEAAVSVLAATMPSLEAQAMPHFAVSPARRSWPPVEVVRPGPEGRAPRLVRALRETTGAFVYEPLRGYGVARVCRACSEPAACAACGGTLRSEGGSIRCVVCEAPGRCANCGARDLGVVRGGAERVEEWVRSLASLEVLRAGPGQRPVAPSAGRVVVGGIEAVKDVGRVGLDLVAILDADTSLRRPGVGARDATLGAWSEVVSWLGPEGRAIVQTSRPNDHTVQALVSGNPERAARIERERLADAGFPVGAPVFRVAGTEGVGAALEALPHVTLLVSGVGEATICLVAVAPDAVSTWGEAVRSLAARGIVSRVEAEPHL